MDDTSSEDDFLCYDEEVGVSNRCVQIRIASNDHLQACRDWLRCQEQNQIAQLNLALEHLEVEDVKRCDDILDSIARNRNIRKLNFFGMVVSAVFFEKLLNNDSSLFLLWLQGCRLSSYSPSGIDKIAQSFHQNTSLKCVLLDASDDVALAKAMLEGLAGHQSLADIVICNYRELDTSFSKSLTNMFCKTRSLHTIKFNHCKISYELFQPIAISILDTNCMSKISTCQLLDCEIVGDNAVSLLQHFFSKAKITTLLISDSDDSEFILDEYKLRISNRVYLNVLVKASNQSVINLWEVAIDDYEYVDKKKSTEAFWDTLTMNNSLQFLNTPTMKHNEIEYAAFLRFLPELKIKGIQLNIDDFPDDKNQKFNSLVLSNAFRNNFSLVCAKVYNNMDDMDDDLVENQLNHYCKRNAVLELLIDPRNDEVDELDLVSDNGPDELILINESYANVKPLPTKKIMLKYWPYLLHQLTECDAPYQHQMVLKCLSRFWMK